MIDGRSPGREVALAALALFTAALAAVAPLFELFRNRFSYATYSAVTEIGGWGQPHRRTTRIYVSRPSLGYSATSGGHEIRWSVVLWIGAAVLLVAGVLLLARQLSAAGAVVATCGATLLVGAMIVALLAGLAQVSQNSRFVHNSVGPAFWLMMAVGVLALAVAALGARRLLRRTDAEHVRY